jgi:chemotaxis family two-component system response regulator Rcp1
MDLYKTVVLIKMSLKDQKIANNPVIANSAEEALNYLEQNKTPDRRTALPDLILLDLNMPGMGGKEFLRRVKSTPEFEAIPVVILTTSESDKDILDSFKLQAAGYVRKPVNIADFQEVMRTLTDYWFTICRHN